MNRSWDYKRIYQNVKDSLPPEYKDHPIDQPVPVVSFEGTMCSIFGNPLEEDHESASYKYRNIEFSRFEKSKQSRLRLGNGSIQILYPEEQTRKGRFLLVHRQLDGSMRPIIEVGNGGRAVMMAKRWCRIVECDFNEDIDNKVVVPEKVYRQQLIRLGKNLISNDF